jgi:hypothetical protein
VWRAPAQRTCSSSCTREPLVRAALRAECICPISLPCAHSWTLCARPTPCMVLDAAGTVIALMAFARHKGVNLSVLGIGVDFLQVRCVPQWVDPSLHSIGRA